MSCWTLALQKKLPGKKMCFRTCVEPYCKLIVTGQNFAYHKDDFAWRPSIYPWPHWWHPQCKIPLENPWKHHFWDSKFQNDPWCHSPQELVPLVFQSRLVYNINLLLKNFLTALSPPPPPPPSPKNGWGLAVIIGISRGMWGLKWKLWIWSGPAHCFSKN